MLSRCARTTQDTFIDRVAIATRVPSDHLANDFNKNIIETCHRNSPLAARRYPYACWRAVHRLPF